MKADMESYVETELDYLRGQVVDLKKELIAKDRVVKQLKAKNSRILVKSSAQSYRGSIQIDFVEEKEEEYSRKL